MALAGRDRRPVLAGEAKWARRVDGPRLLRALQAKALSLPGVEDPDGLRYAIAAREHVDGDVDALTITASDVFSA